MKPEPLPPLPERPVFPAPPEPARGVISWNMNTSCNYRCGYCTQRFLDDRGRWASDLPRFLAAFARLPGAWEIKLSGGEPFVHLAVWGHHLRLLGAPGLGAPFDGQANTHGGQSRTYC